MKKQHLAWSAAVLLLACSLYAQAIKIVVEVPFEFTADGKVYAAGKYEISQAPGAANQLRLREIQSNNSAFVAVLTRISRTDGQESRVVFDKVGENSFLSELHIAGADGFHFKGAPGAHTHVSVKAAK
jgi:hypothetical protein